MGVLCSGTTFWFYIVFRAPSWGSGVLSHFCKYVAGLIQAVLFYLRVVVLCHSSWGVIIRFVFCGGVFGVVLE